MTASNLNFYVRRLEISVKTIDKKRNFAEYQFLKSPFTSDCFKLKLLWAWPLERSVKIIDKKRNFAEYQFLKSPFTSDCFNLKLLSMEVAFRNKR